MKSLEFRSSSFLLRNDFPVTQDYNMPILNRADLPPVDSMLSYHDTRMDDARAQQHAYLIHFFKNDPCFEFLYDKPYGKKGDMRIKKLAQYTAVCTPDFSLYPEMPLPIQQMQVFKSRWCGAHWESMGLLVIPTVTWASSSSFAFCFNGLPIHSVVAISTLGCRAHKDSFMHGYDKMMEVLEPETIICYGDAFEEMEGNILCFPYSAFRKKVK